MVRGPLLASCLCLFAGLLTARGEEQPEPAPESLLARAEPPARKAAPSGERREILLTFDDGPRADLTPQVLDILEARGIKSVFFVNGWRFTGKSAGAERAREILRDMVRRGHLVGNHTIHHYFLCGKRGPRVAVQEIEGNAQLIEQAIGMRPQLFRTPFGSHCKALAQTLAGLGIKPIGWDIDPQDWRLQDTEKELAYLEQALRRLRGRAIVLFHDVQPATVAALPRLLSWIDQENAALRAQNQPELKIIDYRYLLPDVPAIPPVIDGIGRVLVEALRALPDPFSLFPRLWPKTPGSASGKEAGAHVPGGGAPPCCKVGRHLRAGRVPPRARRGAALFKAEEGDRAAPEGGAAPIVGGVGRGVTRA